MLSSLRKTTRFMGDLLRCRSILGKSDEANMASTGVTLLRQESAVFLFIVSLFFLLPPSAHAQSWTWTKELVDTYGSAMSLASDDAGNVHLSYGGGSGLKYGYRPVGADSKWFTMTLGGGVAYTNLKLDKEGNPNICVTYLSLPLRYVHYDGKSWDTQHIAPEDTMGVQAQCSVVVASHGTPHLSWYRLGEGTNHIRYAVLKDGAWLMHTLDFDTQSGKWHWMTLDPDGNPDISYDAFVRGVLKFAHFDGKEWNIQQVDIRGAHGQDYSLGMGSSLMFDSQGKPHISYYSDTEMRHAWLDGQKWKVETVDRISPTGAFSDYRSTILLDKDGVQHISYEDGGIVKHAYKDGEQWRIQVIAPTGASKSRFNSMAIDTKQNIVYIAYQDALDHSLKVAVGHKGQ
jgi:hypothetical protein